MNSVRDAQDPSYMLASSIAAPYSKPRYLRNGMDFSDVEKSTTKSRDFSTPARNLYDVGDIEGAHPKHHTYTRNQTNSNLDYSDVTKKKWQSKRVANPLDPEYRFPIRVTQQQYSTSAKGNRIPKDRGVLALGAHYDMTPET